jgi:hypothetical protein
LRPVLFRKKLRHPPDSEQWEPAGFVCTIATIRALEWFGNGALLVCVFVAYFYFRRFLRNTGLRGFRRR